MRMNDGVDNGSVYVEYSGVHNISAMLHIEISFCDERVVTLAILARGGISLVM